MSEHQARPNLGAIYGIPDIGAWQFPSPYGLRSGIFSSRPVVVGSIKSETVGIGGFNSKIVIEGVFGADQT